MAMPSVSLDRFDARQWANDTVVQSALMLAASYAMYMVVGSRVPTLMAQSAAAAPGLSGLPRSLFSGTGVVAVMLAVAATQAANQAMKVGGFQSYASTSAKQFIDYSGNVLSLKFPLSGGKAKAQRRNFF
ncbi:MAG: hypothetical protein VX463_11775 [Pseudomonadota bacterium]|nr:hypothetical protein [Pseudomonadota bacterium]